MRVMGIYEQLLTSVWSAQPIFPVVSAPCTLAKACDLRICRSVAGERLDCLQNFPEHFIDIQRQSHGSIRGYETERYDRPKQHLSDIGVGSRSEMPEPKQATAYNAKERGKGDDLSLLNAVNIIQSLAKRNFDFFRHSRPPSEHSADS